MELGRSSRFSGLNSLGMVLIEKLNNVMRRGVSEGVRVVKPPR